MKAVIYNDFKDIDFNFIVNTVEREQHGKIAKVSLVIVEVDLFLKLRKEGLQNGYFFSQPWFEKDHLNNGIKINRFRIISSNEIKGEIHLTFDFI